MHRHLPPRRALIPAIVAGAALLLALVSAGAQEPPVPGPAPDLGPPGYMGEPPAAGGMGILLTTRMQTREELMLHLQAAGCAPKAVSLLGPRPWRRYIPGAPGFVNRAFPARIRAGEVLYVHCHGDLGAPVAVDEADDGTTITLGVGQWLRVTLDSNPSTGFSWQVAELTPDGVLQQVGTAVYTPPTGDPLPGAAGHETFTFRAVGEGTATLRLIYLRPWESVPPAETWQIAVVVAP